MRKFIYTFIVTAILAMPSIAAAATFTSQTQITDARSRLLVVQNLVNNLNSALSYDSAGQPISITTIKNNLLKRLAVVSAEIDIGELEYWLLKPADATNTLSTKQQVELAYTREELVRGNISGNAFITADQKTAYISRLDTIRNGLKNIPFDITCSVNPNYSVWYQSNNNNSHYSQKYSGTPGTWIPAYTTVNDSVSINAADPNKCVYSCNATFIFSNTGGCSTPSFSTQATCEAGGSCSNPALTTESACLGAGSCYCDASISDPVACNDSCGQIDGWVSSSGNTWSANTWSVGGACVCPANQHVEGGSCVTDFKEIACGGSAPSAGNNNIINTPGGKTTFTQTWNGTTYLPASMTWSYSATAGDCKFTCTDSTFHEYGGVCVSNSCGTDGTHPAPDTTAQKVVAGAASFTSGAAQLWTSNPTGSTGTCEWGCNPSSAWHPSGNICENNQITCGGTLPTFAVSNAPGGKSTYTWSQAVMAKVWTASTSGDECTYLRWNDPLNAAGSYYYGGTVTANRFCAEHGFSSASSYGAGGCSATAPQHCQSAFGRYQSKYISQTCGADDCCSFLGVCNPFCTPDPGYECGSYQWFQYDVTDYGSSQTQYTVPHLHSVNCQ